MDHYKGIAPDERWKNDVLNELRALNKNLLELSGKGGAQNDNQVVQEVDGSVRRDKRRRSVSGSDH